MRAARVLLAGLVFVGLAALAAPAQASATTGCSYHSRTIRVWIAPNVHAWGVRAAMRMWNGVHRGQPHFRRVYSRSNAQVKVRAYRNYLTQQNGTTAFGCHTGRSPSYMIVSLNAARPITFNSRKIVARHELGHVLGLGHRPHAAHRSLMFPYLWGSTAFPSTLDRRTLGSIY